MSWYWRTFFQHMPNGNIKITTNIFKVVCILKVKVQHVVEHVRHAGNVVWTDALFRTQEAYLIYSGNLLLHIYRHKTIGSDWENVGTPRQYALELPVPRAVFEMHSSYARRRYTMNLVPWDLVVIDKTECGIGHKGLLARDNNIQLISLGIGYCKTTWWNEHTRVQNVI